MRRVELSLVKHELKFSTSRSSGPGGQNVNKTNSKVTIAFDVANSQVLTEEEKQTLLQKLSNKLTTENVLILSSQEKRSQLENKEVVLAKLDQLLKRAFEKKKARKATKPTKSSARKRVDAKKQHSEKKKWRQRPE